MSPDLATQFTQLETTHDGNTPINSKERLWPKHNQDLPKQVLNFQQPCKPVFSCWTRFNNLFEPRRQERRQGQCSHISLHHAYTLRCCGSIWPRSTSVLKPWWCGGPQPLIAPPQQSLHLNKKVWTKRRGMGNLLRERAHKIGCQFCLLTEIVLIKYSKVVN